MNTSHMIFLKGKKRRKKILDDGKWTVDKWGGDGGNKRTKERLDKMIFLTVLIL